MRAVFLVVALAGCVVAEETPPPPDMDVSRVVTFDIGAASGVNWTAPLDLLIVVDTSPAMAEHRDRLVASFERFGAALEYAPGLLPDLHLGVVTADPLDGAAFRRAPSVGGDYIVDTPVSSIERSVNYGAGLGSAIAQLADAGSAGSGTVHAIDAMRLALETDNGFRREHAYLLVVLVTASDDTSGTSIDDAVALLDVHPRPGVAVIGAPAGATCAAPPTRLLELSARVANRSFASICGTAHEDVLSILGNGVYRVIFELPCVREAAFPYECTVEDVYPTTSGEGRHVLRACGADTASRPCWRFEPFEYGCDGFVLHVERSSSPVTGTRTVGQCLAAP